MNKEEKAINKCPICGRPTHKESKYCIFHASAEEKTEEEFKQALKEYVNKIKKEDGDYDFEKFIFVGDIKFKEDLNVTTFKNADFGGAIFERLVLFSDVTFEESANFWGVTFEEGANFGSAIFGGDAFFEEATFRGVTFFEEATFRKGAVFGSATFGEYTLFLNVTFEECANFWGVTFRGDAEFKEVTFRGDAKLWEVTFGGDAEFRKVTFRGDAEFKEVTFGGDAVFLVESFVKGITFAKVSVLTGKKLNLTVMNNKGNVSFERGYLENIYLELHLGVNVLIDFTDTLLRNTKIERDQIEQHILQEKMKEFSQAKEIYLLLKNNFHSIGRYEDKNWAFKKEKDMERLSCSFYSFKKDLVKKKKREIFPILKWMYTKDFKKWIISVFSNMIYGYGERPWNVVKTALAIIIIFALSFSLVGIGNPEIIELKGTGIYQNSGNIVDLASKGLLKNNEIRNFPDCLYFSLITFTTLGYGDFRPLEGWGRILAGSEAFIGAFMMALFVYTFARRTGGR